MSTHATARRLSPLLALAALACDPWGRLDPEGWGDISEPLWDDQLTAVGDTLYVQLPHAGRLLSIDAKGEVREVDLNGARPERVIGLPSGESAFVFASYPVCEDNDEDIIFVEDCPEDLLGSASEVSRISGFRSAGAVALKPHFNTVRFSPDGTTAVAYFSGNSTADIQGVVDLTEVVFQPLAPADAAPIAVSTGSTPTNVLFTTDAAGMNDRAVIMSSSQVMVVSLATGEVQVTYYLALDVDTVIVPQDALVAGGGRFVLLSETRSRELYRLDLINQSIDIEDLEDSPSSLTEVRLPESAGGDIASAITYSSIGAIDLLDGQTNEPIQRYTLDHAVNRLQQSGELLIAYSSLSDAQKDLYIIDLTTNEVDEHRPANPLRSIEISADRSHLVGLMDTDGAGEGNNADGLHGLYVMDLGDRREANLALSSAPVGSALVERDGQNFVLLLLEDDDTLYKVDLSAPSFAVPVELPASPRSLVARADGRIAISHDSALGLISIYDPATDTIEAIHGFANVGLLAEPTLPRRGDD